MNTQVVNVRYTDRYDVYIGRSSKWGNPYRIGVDGDRDEVVDKYRLYLYTRKDLLRCMVKELSGKILACHCKPQRCHGDILVEVLSFMEALTMD